MIQYLSHTEVFLQSMTLTPDGDIYWKACRYEAVMRYLWPGWKCSVTLCR